MTWLWYIWSKLKTFEGLGSPIAPLNYFSAHKINAIIIINIIVVLFETIVKVVSCVIGYQQQPHSTQTYSGLGGEVPPDPLKTVCPFLVGT